MTDKGLRFQQDNAPIHKARKTMKMIHRSHVPLHPHPPQSPDLNIIEMLWSYMKSKVNPALAKTYD